MTEQTHRAGFAPRSGDTHVIDPTSKNAKAVNVDAEARVRAAKEAAAAKTKDAGATRAAEAE